MPEAARPPAGPLHVAIVVDESVLLEESPGVVRTGVGLMGEGVRLTRVLPDHAGPDALAALDLARRIDVPFRPPPWLRRRRRRRLAEAFSRDLPSAVLARGLRAASVAADVAAATGAALVLEAWTPEEALAAVRTNRTAAAAAIVVPTNALAADLRRRVDPGIVGVVPAGVSIPRDPRRILAGRDGETPARDVAAADAGAARDASAPPRAAEGPLAIAAIGEGDDPAAWRAMFEGLDRVRRERVGDDGLHCFCEIRGPHGHEAWREARRLGLLPVLSSIERAADHRRLLLACDLLLLPERSGRLRSIHLEAMAHGIAVVASAQETFEMHEPGVTAEVVGGEDPAEWAARIGGLVADPDRARRIGLAGRERIAATHRSSERVHRLVRLLERATTGGTHRLAG